LERIALARDRNHRTDQGAVSWKKARMRGTAAGTVTAASLRSQATVDQASWMRAMIPHHSIAILTSERAGITDPQAKDLSRRIIDAQRKEIDEMKALIQRLEQGRK
jgi:uncharacterized protein (DUF305 family)